ncbi:MAG TPA: GNAT family N-acetyltransferase [Chloroflexota bacterium]|jgi:GNAT superfamily N-acetyltransferase|nr:GNAT family N-acetyltransferase [Chloroflexota bacterium]
MSVEPLGENTGQLAQLTVRRAGIDDVAVLVDFRLALFRDLDGQVADSALASAQLAIRDYLHRKLPTDSYIAWLAACDGIVVAATSMVLLEKMPSLHNPTGLEGYLMSVYTLPAYRRLGAAAVLVRTALGYARLRGISRVSLHASDQGQPLYERLGFAHISHEMRWVLEQ